MNERFAVFSDALTRMTGPTLFPLSNLERVEAFILARCGQERTTGEPQNRRRQPAAPADRWVHIETHHAVSLDRGVFIHRYSDPEERGVVFVTR